ncbi:MAG: hypothetical protein AAF387_15190 [Pseudomonadota bacterium]
MTTKTRIQKLEEQTSNEEFFTLSVAHGEDCQPYIDAYCEEHDIPDIVKDRALWICVTNYSNLNSVDAA